MYNPSRGGVRGGADQFTWESVKTDKHRENYLGHSVKAPVGRWQKGKDLSWYAKERNDTEDSKQIEKSELAAIKRAEEEAMLIALGHNIVKKEAPSLSKEDIKEALKRNVGNKDELNIERIDGVGAKSGRAALLTGVDRNISKSKSEGVSFEVHQVKVAEDKNSKEKHVSNKSISKSKKKSKKHKKEKKKRSHQESDSDNFENEQTVRKRHKSERTKRIQESNDSSDSESDSISRHKSKKDSKMKRRQNANDSCDSENSSDKRCEYKKKRHHSDDSESDRHSFKGKKHKTHRKENDSNDFNSLKAKHKKKSKHQHQSASDSESNYVKRKSEKHKTHEPPKRHRHDTSDSD
ncbi:multiple myeloma tumor-associated protein 2 homolog [Caerostris extrusa]|uniref:Multiple myeloma tumor-associated protein 2 homolog n=1 Tax=Caerostris extrusa TaxID=172846 RepID=A0AAV4XAX4_CAEEX|nr:multiple myeloma tumor-associated protein 2 homolog [Caerostris extrusa]